MFKKSIVILSLTVEKTKVVLLITLTLARALGQGFNQRPCLPAKNNHSHKEFVKRILPSDFDPINWKPHIKRLQSYVQVLNQSVHLHAHYFSCLYSEFDTGHENSIFQSDIPNQDFFQMELFFK